MTSAHRDRSGQSSWWPKAAHAGLRAQSRVPASPGPCHGRDVLPQLGPCGHDWATALRILLGPPTAGHEVLQKPHRGREAAAEAKWGLWCREPEAQRPGAGTRKPGLGAQAAEGPEGPPPTASGPEREGSDGVRTAQPSPREGPRRSLRRSCARGPATWAPVRRGHRGVWWPQAACGPAPALLFPVRPAEGAGAACTGPQRSACTPVPVGGGRRAEGGRGAPRRWRG